MTRFARRRGLAVRGRPADVDEPEGVQTAAGAHSEENDVDLGSATADAGASAAGRVEDVPDQEM